MTGIRKRVTIGFLSIVVLLFFSGLVSLFELNHMSQDIDAILSSNRQGIALSESMLDAIRANDRAVIRYAVLRDTTYADSCKVSASIFAQTIASAREKITSSDNASLFDSLDVAAQRLSSLVEQLHASGRVEQSVRIDDFWGVVPTFNGSEWYNKEFLPIYNNASGHILQVLTYAQNSLTPRAERLSRNAWIYLARGDDSYPADVLLLHHDLCHQTHRSDEQKPRRLVALPPALYHQGRMS